MIVNSDLIGVHDYYMVCPRVALHTFSDSFSSGIGQKIKSAVVHKVNKGRRMFWLRTVMNIMVITMNTVETGMMNCMLRSRVMGLEKWEEISVTRSEHPIMPAWFTSDERK